jgi:hypothetical protein
MLRGMRAAEWKFDALGGNSAYSYTDSMSNHPTIYNYKSIAYRIYKESL